MMQKRAEGQTIEPESSEILCIWEKVNSEIRKNGNKDETREINKQKTRNGEDNKMS